MRAVLCAALAALLALLFCAPPTASAEPPEWKSLVKSFEHSWKGSQEAKSATRHQPAKPGPGPWEGARQRQRTAVETLVKAQDARAVAVLLDTHAKHLDFIQDVQRKHDRRLLRWKALQTFMELTRAKRKKDEAARREGSKVSEDEKRWNEEQFTLPSMWATIISERKLTAYLRRSIAAVAAGLEKPERARAHALVPKALTATWKTHRKIKEDKEKAPHRPVFPPESKPRIRPGMVWEPVKPKSLPKFEPDVWEEIREKQRAASDTLARLGDGDAVAALVAVHKKLLKSIEVIEKEYEGRLAKWKKLQPSMERALAGRQVTNGVMRGSKSEDIWINEQYKLEGMWANVMRGGRARGRCTQGGCACSRQPRGQGERARAGADSQGRRQWGQA